MLIIPSGILNNRWFNWKSIKFYASNPSGYHPLPRLSKKGIIPHFPVGITSGMRDLLSLKIGRRYRIGVRHDEVEDECSSSRFF